MSTFSTLIFAFLTLSQIALAETEQDVFLCQSPVPGFENFRVTQVLQDNSMEAKYRLKIDGTEEVWDQLGKAQLASGTPLFASQFRRLNSPPVLPLPPEAPPEEINDDKYLYAFVSINESGSGSLSIRASLDPLVCQRLF